VRPSGFEPEAFRSGVGSRRLSLPSRAAKTLKSGGCEPPRSFSFGALRHAYTDRKRTARVSETINIVLTRERAYARSAMSAAEPTF
jgi:hypothetical protein